MSEIDRNEARGRLRGMMSMRSDLSANDREAVGVVLAELARLEHLLSLPTVPASEHQRVQAELEQRTAEAAAMRRALEAQEKVKWTIGCHDGVNHSTWEIAREGGCKQCIAVALRKAALSSSAGATLLEEVEGLRRERDELCAKVEARPTCDHREAVFRCAGCVARVRERMPEFPLQSSRPPVKPGPASVPWPVAERAWATYAQKYGREQSVERMAQRGGFGWGEMDMFFPGWRDATDAWKRLESESADLRARLAENEKWMREAMEAIKGLAAGPASFTGHPVVDVVAELRARLESVTAQKDGAYRERDAVVALLAHIVGGLGWRAGIGQHPAEDISWDEDWRTIIFIDLPTGQASWHVHDSERHLLDGLPPYPDAWDGHSTTEKYRRCALVRSGPQEPAVAAEVRRAVEAERASIVTMLGARASEWGADTAVGHALEVAAADIRARGKE